MPSICGADTHSLVLVASCKHAYPINPTNVSVRQRDISHFVWIFDALIKCKDHVFA